MPNRNLSVSESLDMVRRGTVEIIDESTLAQKLEAFKQHHRPLRIKLGFDPSSPDIHLGHTVILNKLRDFQNLGHIAVFVIGDFTARIGDPSGRNKLRPPLSTEEITYNAQTYTEQAFKILDPQKTEVVYNHNWLSHLSASDIINLCAKMSVAQVLERDDFAKRYQSKIPIFLHEFIYPLLQGYDSVILKCDVEIGGTDQKFNLLVGRHLQRAFGLSSQDILTMPLLVGLDGKQKMSKTYDNAIALNDPPIDMFGKLMSISDAMMIPYYELLSFISSTELERLKNELRTGESHPMTTKMALAHEVTSRFHGKTSAEVAKNHFESVHRQGDIPDNVPTILIEEAILPLSRLVYILGLTPSIKESRRKIEEGAVTINGEKITDPMKNVEIPATPQMLRLGKRHFRKYVRATPTKI